VDTQDTEKAAGWKRLLADTTPLSIGQGWPKIPSEENHRYHTKKNLKKSTPAAQISLLSLRHLTYASLLFKLG